ncbi:unnamed protein product [Linum trigynum]|uniref:Uncharacterized protein n=1 Tax=Linum trigynum TaxID=586398 RepID=A0AAV2E6A6_9ROSI
MNWLAGHPVEQRCRAAPSGMSFPGGVWRVGDPYQELHQVVPAYLTKQPPSDSPSDFGPASTQTAAFYEPTCFHSLSDQTLTPPYAFHILAVVHPVHPFSNNSYSHDQSHRKETELGKRLKLHLGFETPFRWVLMGSRNLIRKGKLQIQSDLRPEVKPTGRN